MDVQARLEAVGDDPLKQAILERRIRESWEWRACAEHPAALLSRVQCIDAKTGERFEFDLDPEHDPETSWSWQREVLDLWLKSEKSVVLKARQLGITWLGAGLALWFLLYKPGARVLVVSINEEEAAKVINRIWDMLQSLPEHLRPVEVLKPTRGARPHQAIEVKHKDGRISTVLGLPSTKKAGHGETAALVLLDEFARQDYARETWKAVLPTMSGGGRVLVISTGNGISTQDGGNFFHHLWANADAYGIDKHFLRWDKHPDRDDAWYRTFAMALPSKDRAEQYPADEHEAFILTGDPYFDIDALAWYAKEGLREPLYKARFEKVAPNRAKLVKGQGLLRVYEEPTPEHEYAVAADVATGRGTDYSAAYVLDLETMAPVASAHGKIDADLYAEQLHFLGRWYNTARIAPEMGGGYGEPIVISLRHGKDGRPPYPKLYRHRHHDRGDQPEAAVFGFPMTTKSRPQVLAMLERALRERSLPYIESELLHELHTFVFRETPPTPRAQDGCNDDRVMAAAIAMELFRQFGHHPHKHRPKKKRPRLPPYPWSH